MSASASLLFTVTLAATAGPIEILARSSARARRFRLA